MPAFSLPFTGRTAPALNPVYTAYCPQPSDVGDIMALQLLAEQEMEAIGKPHFLRSRTEQSILQHLEAGHFVVGIKNSQGQHIAHALITDPARDGTMNLDGYPCQDGDLIVQTFYIREQDRYKNLDAAWRNTHNPGLLIFEAARTIAAERGYTRLLAKVATDNPSRKTFMLNGFAATGRGGVDAKIGYSYQYYAAPVPPAPGAQYLAQPARTGVSLGNGGSAILLVSSLKGSPYARP